MPNFKQVTEQSPDTLWSDLGPSHCQRSDVLTWLADNVPQPRLQHILRVEQMSIQLAQQHQLDVLKAAQAGLMHDLAKYFKAEQLLAIARAEGWSLTAVDTTDPHLLHADVGAVVARDHFKIRDPEILDAIRLHTLGEPEMSLLSCVVFLADSLEPGRGDKPDLAVIREVSRRDLIQAVRMVCDRTLHHLMKHQRLIHPRMIATRNWTIQLTAPDLVEKSDA